jgi:hypothetical protein
MADRPPRTARGSDPRTRAGAAATVLVLGLGALVVTRAPLRTAAAAPPKGGPPVAYAASTASPRSIEVIDTDVHKSVKSIPLGGDTALALAVTSDARYVLASVTTPQPIPGSGGGVGPVPLAIVPAAVTGPRIAVIEVATNTLIVDADASLGMAAQAVVAGPDPARAYAVSSSFSPTTPSEVTVLGVSSGPKPLSIVSKIPLTGIDRVSDAVVSPDGQTLYVLSPDGALITIKLPGTVQAPFQLPITGRTMVMSPQGGELYVGFGDAIPSLVAVDVKGPAPVVKGVDLPDFPIDLAIGTRPDGTSTLYVGVDSVPNAPGGGAYPIPLPIPAGFKPATALPLPPIPSVGTPTGTAPVALFATPDGNGLEVSTGSGSVVAFDTTTRKPDGCDVSSFPGATPPPAATPCPRGGGAVVVTPDQRPTADFTFAPGPPGQPTSFDASGSTIAFGTVTRYVWDFGDGTPPATQAVPTTEHVYATAGIYSVTLTETDWAGTSVGTSPPSTVFTGQTMTRRGGPPSRIVKRVTISSSPESPGPSPSPGPGPVIALVPPVGPPGTVVTVTGTGFPADRDVLLDWDRGIGSVTARTVGDGTFLQTVLVFPRDDSLGFRMMTTPDFGAAPVPFLVEPPSLQPGGSDVTVIFRR